MVLLEAARESTRVDFDGFHILHSNYLYSTHSAGHPEDAWSVSRQPLVL